MPCNLKHKPKKSKQQFYKLKNHKYQCVYIQPEINHFEGMLIELYNESSMARNSDGGLNYNVLLEVARVNGVRDISDLLYLAGQIDYQMAKLKGSK